MRVYRAAIGVGCVVLLVGCDIHITDLGDNWTCGFMGESCLPAVGLELEPSFAWLLKGDTVLGRARSDSGHGVADWTISGAARFIEQAALTDRVGASETVRMKLIDVGTTTIQAKSTNSSHLATSTYNVADSSAITAVSFWQLAGVDSMAVPKSYQFWIFCAVRDAATHAFFARPTSWSSSDSSVATIEQDVSTRGCAGIIRTKAAGMARLTARFLGVSTAVRVYVSP